jgi:flagellar motor switch protein FliM
MALAFGEAERPDGAPLSQIESRVLDRIVSVLLPFCAGICGPLGAVSREDPDLALRECGAYFELRISARLSAAIGIALTRDPPEDVRPSLRAEDVHDVAVEACVELARGTLAVGALSTLRTGATIPLATGLDDPGVLLVGGRPVASGTCGVHDGRCAFSVGATVARGAAA